MEIFLALVLFAVGVVVMVKGADFFVSASSWVSDVTGISKILIGATVVAFATSGPELFVSLIAAMEGKVDMSIGNVVGSHLCNLGLGFSLIAICRPMKNNEKLFLPNGIIMIFAAVLLLVFCLIGVLTIFHGIILMLIFVVFTYINIRYSEANVLEATPVAETAINSNPEENENIVNSVAASATQTQQTQAQGKPIKYKKPTNNKEITINIFKFVIGLAAIILGSKLVVDKATIIAKAMGVSEMFIGLTIVAIGTSLPEIVTTIAAIIKKEMDLGIGNIVGSCIFNNTFILAVAAFVTGGLTFNDSLLVDLPIAIALMLISVLPTVIGKKIYRWQGILLVVGYLAYIIYLGFFGI